MSHDHNHAHQPSTTVLWKPVSKRTGRRKTYGNGNLRPLEERLNPAQMERRQTRITARQTVAVSLGRTQALQAGALAMHHQILRRGFFGRLKWLILGR